MSKVSFVSALLLMAASLFLTSIMVEILLRFTNLERPCSQKYPEGLFGDPYNLLPEDQYFMYPPNFVIPPTTDEFDFVRKTNTDGFVTKPFPNSFKPQNSILVFGDSFTEGVGAETSGSWPHQLERLLADRDIQASVYNCGKAASDPFFNFKVFQDQFQHRQPSMVILCVNLTDVLDITIRGGMERFKPNGSVQYSDPPLLYWLFRRSRMFRLLLTRLLHFDHNMIRMSDPEVFDDAKSLLNQAIRLFSENCSEKGINFLLVVHPVPNSEPIEQKTGMLSAIDFNPVSEKLFLHFQKLYKNGELEDYYWPKDGHFNEAGYGIVASLVADHIVAETDFMKKSESVSVD